MSEPPADFVGWVGAVIATEQGTRIPADISLADELSGEHVVEMANLTSAQTGVSGTIFISTAMGAHRPRVKYFVRPGRTQPIFPCRSRTRRRSWRTVCRPEPSANFPRKLSSGSGGTGTRCWISGIKAIPGRSLRSMTSSNSSSEYESSLR